MIMKTWSASERVIAPVPGRNWQHWPRTIGRWFERSRQRQALAALDQRLLDDVGITPIAAAREIAKPFWR